MSTALRTLSQFAGFVFFLNQIFYHSEQAIFSFLAHIDTLSFYIHRLALLVYHESPMGQQKPSRRFGNLGEGEPTTRASLVS
jgi:hypothetical protein